MTCSHEICENKVTQEAMFVHVFYYLEGRDVFQHLAKDACKGYGTEVYSLRFVTLELYKLDASLWEVFQFRQIFQK